MDGRSRRIALSLQGRDTVLQGRPVGDRAREAATLEDADFKLGDALANCHAWASDGSPDARR